MKYFVFALQFAESPTKTYALCICLVPRINFAKTISLSIPGVVYRNALDQAVLNMGHLRFQFLALPAVRPLPLLQLRSLNYFTSDSDAQSTHINKIIMPISSSFEFNSISTQSQSMYSSKYLLKYRLLQTGFQPRGFALQFFVEPETLSVLILCRNKI